MTRPMPEHGTRARYIRGCHCNACHEANGRYCKAYRTHTHRSSGQPKRLDPAPVTQRIHYWKSRGYSHTQIAKAANVARRVIDIHAKGDLKTINPDTAHKILTARLDDSIIPDHIPVDATGTIRRLRALLVMGHQIQDIAAASGHVCSALSKILNGHSVNVRGGTAQGIAALYETWQHTHGRCERTRQRAAAEGWHGPDAWDNDEIDNPEAKPYPLTHLNAVDLAKERAAEVHLLASAGNTFEVIAARIGISPSGVRQILRRDHPTLYLALTA